MVMLLDWLIVGGGIHGTFLSNYLLKRKGVDRDKLAVLDNQAKPLANWLQQTDAVAMKYLRSPVEHNLDVGGQALRKWSHDNNIPDTDLYSKYDRPSLRSFNSHALELIDRNQLESLRIIGAAKVLSKHKENYLLKTDDPDLVLSAKNVIICTGQANRLAIPAWARLSCKIESAPIVHLFDKRYQTICKTVNDGHIVIIGGGISAVQAALSLSEKHPGKVVLLHRYPLQTYQFDADPCWLSTRCLSLLRQTKNLTHRRRIVEGARHKGSFPSDIAKQLDAALDLGQLRCHLGEVSCFDHHEHLLNLVCGKKLPCDLLVLATGFAENSTSDFVRDSMQALNLKATPCGIPEIDYFLRADKGLFVSGPLAELELGPAARNIVGARIAAERICQIGRSKKPHPKEYNYYFMASKRG